MAGEPVNHQLPADADLNDVAGLLSAAAALGAFIPAPAGTTIFLADLFDSADQRRTVGAFTSERAACHALAADMIRAWRISGLAPRLWPWLAAAYAERSKNITPTSTDRELAELAAIVTDDEPALLEAWLRTHPHPHTLLDALVNDRSAAGYLARWKVTQIPVAGDPGYPTADHVGPGPHLRRS